MSDPAESKSHPTPRFASVLRWAPWIVAAVVFAVFLPLFYSTAQTRARIFNTDSAKSSFLDSTDEKEVKVHVIFHHDQHVYMNLGRLLRLNDYDYFIPRQRTPGYPLLMSLLYDEDDEYQFTPGDGDPRRITDAMFARAREFNIILSMFLLVGLFFFGIKLLGIYGSLLFTWICGWTLFVFKTVFVQPEMLFYTLFLMSFVVLWRQIDKPTWTRGIAGGVLVAAAYFIKSAIPPLLLLFTVCFAIRRFIQLGKTIKTDAFTWKAWFLDVAKGAVIPVIWVVLLSPYFLETWKTHGSPFWSIHSSHLMWQEDASTKGKWRNLDEPGIEIPADAPSFEKYWAEHRDDPGHFIDRPVEGAQHTLTRIRREFEPAYNLVKKRLLRVSYVIAILFCIPILRALKRSWLEVFYIVGFFLGYGALYGWLEAIRAGPRLMLSLFAPLVFVLMAFLNRFADDFTLPKLGWKIPMKPILYSILAVCLCVAVYRIIGQGDASAAWNFEGGS